MICFFDVRNGCAGDMICGALAGCVDLKEIEEQLKKIEFPSKYQIEVREVKRPAGLFHGLKAHQFLVNLTEKEEERSYNEILSIFKKSHLPDRIKTRILNVFRLIAEAESKVHGTDLKNLHFHAVGQTDALVEVSFSVIALEYLGVKKIFSSPVGISKAAPATMEMIKGIPVIVRDIPFEITTPTGIAIIRAMADSFGETPAFVPEGHSFGTGTIETEFPDTLGFIFGKELKVVKDQVFVIETSLDDQNPMVFDYLIDKLYQAGALEVSFFTGLTKKSRPIFWLRVLCHETNREKIFQAIFKETSTIGLRYREEERIVLEREKRLIKTRYGDVNIKIAYYSGEVVNIMPEYEDCKRIAVEKNVPLKKVIDEVLKLAL